MAIEAWWYFKLYKCHTKVTKPHPWIDAHSLADLGDELRRHLYAMAPKAQRLQELGWVLKLSEGAVIACHEDIDSQEEGKHHLIDAGIDVDEVTFIVRNEWAYI